MAYITAYITFKNQREAKKIGSVLVEEGLAACINIIPRVVSIYKWDWKLETSEETVAFVKTKKGLFKKLEARVKELHSYENPCITAFEIKEGSPEFLAWIEAQTN